LKQLAEILRTKGPDKLRNTLEGMKSKRAYLADIRGWLRCRRYPFPPDCNQPRHHDDDPPARSIPFIELRNSPRSRYEFGIVQLQINDKGENKGLMYPLSKVRFNKDNDAFRRIAVSLWLDWAADNEMQRTDRSKSLDFGLSYCEGMLSGLCV
jgi:hypothetical protein